MAAPSAKPLTERDQASAAEARALAARARAAQALLGEFSQAQVDAIVDRMAAAAVEHAEPLARLAVEETGYGVVADKVQKNLFAARDVHAFIRPIPTVGVVARHEDRKVIDIAEPFGVVAAIVPSTNPTSTAIYKLLITIKARCAVVVSPHPSAARCITRTVSVMADAAREAGLPDGAIGWMTTVTLAGTQALMQAREVAVILATGGLGLVRAAYSAGKPAYGVGPGNAPCYVESSADIAGAADDILAGKAFDHGVLCSSPNAVVVDRAVAPAAALGIRRTAAATSSRPGDTDKLTRALVGPERLPNPALVGKSAEYIAQQVGIPVPAGTRALLAELGGVGRDYPLSIEKLCPVLAYYEVRDWREGCERCTQILRYGGLGHTMSIHSRNEAVILEFGLHKPAFRICVNTLDHARLDWPDHRPRPGHDAGLRRVRRQHHLGQHHPAAPAQHQAPRLRAAAAAADRGRQRRRRRPRPWPPAGRLSCPGPQPRRRRRRFRPTQLSARHRSLAGEPRRRRRRARPRARAGAAGATRAGSIHLRRRRAARRQPRAASCWSARAPS